MTDLGCRPVEITGVLLQTFARAVIILNPFDKADFLFWPVRDDGYFLWPQGVISLLLPLFAMTKECRGT
jgi:hypothetical protein